MSQIFASFVPFQILSFIFNFTWIHWLYLDLYCMPWDYKRDFEFLANVVKMQHTFYFLVGKALYSEHSVNPLDFFFRL